MAEAYLSRRGGIVEKDETLVVKKDVNFYDYDMKRIASYTLLEAQALAALPTQPTHEGLTAQGWNHTLAQVNATTRPIDVGAMYITDDGKTRLYITLPDNEQTVVTLMFNQSVAYGVTIDWGDSATQTLSGTGNVNLTHTYAASGDYVITLNPQSGCSLNFGANSSTYCIMGLTGTYNKVYCNMLRKVEIGSNVSTINAYAFNYCYSLKNIIIPNGVTNIGNRVFEYCQSLQSVVFPSSVTTLGETLFSNCTKLESVIIPPSVSTHNSYMFSSCTLLLNVIIPSGVTAITNGMFSNCYMLQKVIVPANITYISDNAFSNCYGVGAYYFLSTTPPTLQSTSVFSNITGDTKMYVPAASLNTYKAATNWSTYASRMIGI